MRRPLIAADPDDLVRRTIAPGSHVHLAGTPSRPNALTYALCRVLGPAGHLTVSTTAVHSAAHALALSGVADRVIAGFVGDTFPSPRPNPLYQDLAAGRPFVFEAWSLLSYVQRLIAGALGLPYAVTRSLEGTDLAAELPGELHRVPDPARSGDWLTLVTPLRPDLTLVHGVCADEDGNIALVPPLGEDSWSAYAARRGVIASVERIVSRAELRACADRVVVPGERVLGLCEAPLGAHPQSLRTGDIAGIRGYLDDYAFLEQIVDSCAGARGGADWYAEWVAEPASHTGYLDRIGADRQAVLAADSLAAAEPTAAEPTAPPSTNGDGAASRQERLIVLAARAIVDQVRSTGYDMLLAGIGTSHLAAWLAAALLRGDDHQVKVAAELGMYGFTPQYGDVYLFSLAHAAHSEMLTGIPQVLGGMVAANPRALGVLAAAEIDETGAINTSRGADGRWLTGSGGANDIASTADCLVVAPSSPRRYVTKLSYRTSPGHRVREVVSDFGRFQRNGRGAGFRLATWLPADAEEPAGRDHVERQAHDVVTRRTGWYAEVSGLAVEEPVTARELRLLRTLDPDGRYR